jgi:hypothetical protein
VTADPFLTGLDRARSLSSSLDCNISASVTAGVCRAPMSTHSDTETRSVAQFCPPNSDQRRSGVCDGSPIDRAWTDPLRSIMVIHCVHSAAVFVVGSRLPGNWLPDFLYEARPRESCPRYNFWDVWVHH